MNQLDLLQALDVWSAEMERSASAVEAASDGYVRAIADGNRALSRILRSASTEIRRLRGLAPDLSNMTKTAVELAHLRAVLDATGGNRAATARVMGIGERTIHRMIVEFGHLLE